MTTIVADLDLPKELKLLILSKIRSDVELGVILALQQGLIKYKPYSVRYAHRVTEKMDTALVVISEKQNLSVRITRNAIYVRRDCNYYDANKTFFKNRFYKIN